MVPRARGAKTPRWLKSRRRNADTGRVTDASRPPTESGEAARLRHRLRELSRRRDRAIERVALFPNPANARQLESMRFEFAELEWRLAELEGAPAAPTS
jgi:hypothetical protein